MLEWQIPNLQNIHDTKYFQYKRGGCNIAVNLDYVVTWDIRWIERENAWCGYFWSYLLFDYEFIIITNKWIFDLPFWEWLNSCHLTNYHHERIFTEGKGKYIYHIKKPWVTKQNSRHKNLFVIEFIWIIFFSRNISEMLKNNLIFSSFFNKLD